MSHARAKRRFNRWQRYDLRYPGGAGHSKFVYHRGYVNAHWKVLSVGRYAPHGIRSRVWMVGTVTQRQHRVENFR